MITEISRRGGSAPLAFSTQWGLWTVAVASSAMTAFVDLRPGIHPLFIDPADSTRLRAHEFTLIVPRSTGGPVELERNRGDRCKNATAAGPGRSRRPVMAGRFGACSRGGL